MKHVNGIHAVQSDDVDGGQESISYKERDSDDYVDDD